MEQQHSRKTDNIDIPIIGIRKYEFLQGLNHDQLTDQQKIQMRVYESKQKTSTPEQIAKQHAYFDKIFEEKEKTEFSISAKMLFKLFEEKFPEVNGRPFERVKGVWLQNLEPLIYYFSKDPRFFDCQNLSKLSEPSFEKGLLIIGTFGNGKTSTMKVFEKIFKGIPGVTFKGFSANEVVMMFERCTGDQSEDLRNQFSALMNRGQRYFDDLKTERIASNFGKVNIFKEILEERYNRKSNTFVTCNFKDGHEGNLEAAVDEFGEKYGARVYDRVFDMFNIVEFKGKSFRK